MKLEVTKRCVASGINIVKKTAISMLTFVFSVLNTPDTFATEVNKLIFGYVWTEKSQG